MAFEVIDNGSALATLARFYEIAFDRAGDGNGLAYWAEALESEAVTLDDLGHAFLNTREAVAVLGDGEDAEFAATLLSRAFGRDATQAEIDAVVADLAGGASRGAVLAELAGSAEAQAATDVVGDGLSIADFTAETFRFGVASGDPDATSVVLWTHARPAGEDGPVTVGWEVSTDPDFTDIVASGETATDASRDYTVNVLADGLEPGGNYYYRFTQGDAISDVGQTLTLPEGSVDALTFAVFSCSNYPAGYFNSYAAAAEAGFDVSIHLGDYIYEYEFDGFASENAAEFGRVSSPRTELFTAEDYSLRYQQYTRDADLQAVRASAPMIAIWDDHETANDSYLTGAENHQEDEGVWEERRDIALETYYNWMPIREPASGDLRDADRSFEFGDLADLHILETRLQARDVQLDYANGIGERIGAYTADTTGATFAADVAAFPELVPEGLDPTDPATLSALSADPDFVQALALQTVLDEAENGDRDLLGEAQLSEFEAKIEASDATWQILGQQILMNQMELPAPLLIDPATLPDYLTIAGTLLAGGTLTPEQQALWDAPAIPYNLDAWDGYGSDREAVLQTLIENDANAIVLAGDTHNAWFSELLARNGETAAFEFGGPGVSSPGLEDFLAGVDPALVEFIFTDRIDTLSYANTSNRGYMEIVVTPEAVTSNYVYVDTVDSLDFDTFTESQTVELELFV